MSSGRLTATPSWFSVAKNPDFIITRLSRVELLTVTNVLWSMQRGGSLVGVSQGFRPQSVNVLGKDFHLSRIHKGTVITGPTWEAIFKDVYFNSEIDILLKGSEDDFRNDLLIIRLTYC
ncbi:MAG: hypothetical protein EOP83_28265 [Verrucomicrobiaceae bacterium]|nr:MAG: hypothetical protein EOP83_28265 [Verrucomicrobiaceae bacterium]